MTTSSPPKLAGKIQVGTILNNIAIAVILFFMLAKDLIIAAQVIQQDDLTDRLFLSQKDI